MTLDGVGIGEISISNIPSQLVPRRMITIGLLYWLLAWVVLQGYYRYDSPY